MRQIVIVLLTLISTIAYAQRGTIRGTVYDGSTGETLVGVSVVIKGTYIGTATDLDGQFSLETEPGTYDLQLSFISFQPLTIEGVEVKPNEVTLLNNLQLNESTVELEDVVVTAKAIRNTEAALQTMKRKSTVMLDGISAAKMELIGDGNAVEAAKRVTGVTVEGGKYVYVRGLGDRYSKTTLNHVDIPGLDPDRNSLQMDIFPVNLIDNMIVSKNFTADQPADFSGGLMNVEIKDFPERKIFSVSASTSFNPDMHFNNDYLAYEGGATDFLGFDDGTRAIPDGVNPYNIPTPYLAPDDEVNNFVRSFSSTLDAKRRNSFIDYGASITFGNQIDINKNSEDIGSNSRLGYIFSLSYKSEYKYYNDVLYGEFQRAQDASVYEMQPAVLRNGEEGERNVLIGLLGGIAYKTNFTKIRLTATRLQSGDSKAGEYDIEDKGIIGKSGYTAYSDNLEYNQRELTNVLLNGNHIFDKSGWELDWRVSPTISKTEDPDIRKTAFTVENKTYFSAGAGGLPSRIWRSLDEISGTAKIDVTKDYKISGKNARLKFGTGHTYKKREYEILQFDMQFADGSQEWPVPHASEVLNPEYIFPSETNGIYYSSGNQSPNPNAYDSNINNTSAYISNEFSVLPRLKTILGVRLENYVHRHTGRDQEYANGNTTSGNNLDNEVVLESTNLFPSVNLIYSLTENQNLRASYSRTIARPSFKELSFAQIIDPVTDRIFNGSLFEYSDWDGELVETNIDNADLRWELFGDLGQMVSVSTFYKKFKNPIEMVRIPEQQTTSEYQARNVGDGRLFGVELEFVKNLKFLSPALDNWGINGNLTLVDFEIEMTDKEYNSRKSFEREGETISRKREMAGQSPYVINGGLTYENREAGLNAGLFYNVKGPTLKIVGTGLFPDVYDMPFHSLNFSLSKKFGENKNTKIDFNVSNILDQSRESVYKSYEADDRVYEYYTPGRSFSIGLSYKF